MGSPSVSIVMSVYNDGAFLIEAIESILNQTLPDFEFIIIDDASTDATPDILDRYKDPRIVRLRNETNVGLTRSLNKGLAIAGGRYIGRQDADDISHADRLRQQVAILENRSDIVALGSWYILINSQGTPTRTERPPIEDVQIQEALFLQNPICHGSVLMRREAVESVGGYREQFMYAQDWDLWLRLGEHGSLANLPVVLYQFRIRKGSLSAQNRSRQRYFARLAVSDAAQRRNACTSPRPMTATEKARYHLHLALDELTKGECHNAATHLQQAFLLERTLASRDSFVLEMVVYWAIDIQREIPNKHTDLGAAFIDRFFAVAPDDSEIASLSRQTKGWYHIVRAFMAYQDGDYPRVRKHVLLGLALAPQWLRNRGVLSILAQACRFPSGRPPKETR